MAFVPRYSHFVALGFLMTVLALAGLAVLSLVALVAGRRRLAWKTLAGGCTLAAAYFVVLLLASLTSRERVLGMGEWKYFCETDCHEAYSVVKVETAKALGAPPGQVAAHGTFYLVTVKVWFDERTISASRPREAPLTPNPRLAFLVDGLGRGYHVSFPGQAALDESRGKSISFAVPIRPGESYETTLVFDLPATAGLPQDAPSARLFVTTEPRMARFIIGHENSPLHKRVYFSLTPPRASVSSTGFALTSRRESTVIKHGMPAGARFLLEPMSVTAERLVRSG